MGITFLVFATPLARERRNCGARSTRPRAKCMNIRNQKWQYYIRGVEKMKKLQKTSRHLNKHQVEHVQKTIDGSKILARARKNNKGQELHAAILICIF